MTSTSDLRRIVLSIGLGASLAACGLPRPPDPPPFDCATIDRASERFPDECPAPSDAGLADAGSTP